MELLQALNGPSSFPKLDNIERSLLNPIASHFFEGRPLLVSTLIFTNKTASSAMLYRRLSKLHKKGLIR